MNGQVIPREQCYINARRALDAARERRDRARAAGLLDPAKELVLRRIEREIAAEQAAARAAEQANAPHRAAA
ncbi:MULTISPECIES: hypothetical protein [unclassified Streptomyces]|uniref:hypothetical protein n=1 Tax=unclassified Streptomyces TaxID=2593676 RepID=UPI00364846F6